MLGSNEVQLAPCLAPPRGARRTPDETRTERRRASQPRPRLLRRRLDPRRGPARRGPFACRTPRRRPPHRQPRPRPLRPPLLCSCASPPPRRTGTKLESLKGEPIRNHFSIQHFNDLKPDALQAIMGQKTISACFHRPPPKRRRRRRRRKARGAR